MSGDVFTINGDYYNKRRLLKWAAIFFTIKAIITINGDYYNERRFFLQ